MPIDGAHIYLNREAKSGPLFLMFTVVPECPVKRAVVESCPRLRALLNRYVDEHRSLQPVFRWTRYN